MSAFLPEAGRGKRQEARKHPPPKVLKRSRPSKHLDFRTLVSRTVREQICIVLNQNNDDDDNNNNNNNNNNNVLLNARTILAHCGKLDKTAQRQ